MSRLPQCYAECRYAECRGAIQDTEWTSNKLVGVLLSVISFSEVAFSLLNCSSGFLVKAPCGVHRKSNVGRIKTLFSMDTFKKTGFRL